MNKSIKSLLVCFLTSSLVAISQLAAAKKLIADNALIVDCMLPGKVSQLGTRRAYVSKKRPIKASADECEIRGGDYVKYDRATVASALKVWLESATLGEAEAQYYVGEIYEKGMGQPPDVDLALVWYKKSAAQNYGPALMSLGRMYEGGMGVEKDLAKAMNLYRKASGLDGEQIEYASVFEKARLEDTQEIQSLRQALSQEKQTSAELSAKLTRLQGRLGQSKQNIQKLKADVAQQEQALKESKSGAPPKGRPDTLKMETELAEARKALDSHKLMMAALRSELEIARTGESTNTFIADELKAAQKTLKAQQRQARKKEKATEALKTKLAKLQASIENKSPEKQLKLVKKQLTKEKEALSQDLAKMTKQYTAQQDLVKELKAKLVGADQDNTADISAYKYDLEHARQVAEDWAVLTVRQEQQIQLLEKELLALKDQSAQLEPADQLAKVKDTLQAREKYYQNQLQLLEIEISKQQGNVKMLNDRLNDASKSNADNSAYVKGLEAQLAEASQKLQNINQSVETKNVEIQTAYATIDSLKASIAALPKKESFEQLEATLQAKQELLEQEESNNEKLKASLEQLKRERDQANHQIDKMVPKDGPVIALRWPKLDASDGIKKAVVGAGSVVNIVGAVYPNKTISQFKVNGKTEQLDTNGLFLTTVEISDTAQTVEIEAVDEQGRSSKTALVIEPTTTGRLALTGGGKLTTPKIKFGKFYALVIGNNAYDQQQGWPALKTATNDAKAIAEVLEKKYGFEVSLKLNANRDEMLISLEEMRRKLTEEDNLLVYYAGHGFMDPENDQGYWIPVDGSTASTVKWVSNATITDQIRAMTARNVMVVADSCYSGSLMRSGIVTLRSGLSVKKKIQRLLDDINTTTRMSLSSGGLQPVADAIGNSNHSVFANALLSVLKQNDSLLDGDALATRVGMDVAVNTRDNVKQVPRYAPLSRGGHQGGEFYFVPKGWKS